MTSGPTADAGIFRNEGDFWQVGCRGRSHLLKDAKGFGYLAYLLRYPFTEFHVLDLVAGVAHERADEPSGGTPTPEEAGARPYLGDAGEMVDAQAKAAYRLRLAELRETTEDAKRVGDVARAESAEREISALARELARAVGVAGRDRRAASASERARQTVTKTIKAAVGRIGRLDAELGALLGRSIRTGTFCSYQPDPELPVVWEFAASDQTASIDSGRRRDARSAPREGRPDDPRYAPAVLPPTPFPLAQRTPFVGRDGEHTVIRTILDAAIDGLGAVAMLGGEAGVGKTRLAMEMARIAAAKGYRFFVGRCYEREESIPYVPFVEIVESVLAQTGSVAHLREWLGDDAPEIAQMVPSLRRVFPNLPERIAVTGGERRRHLFESFGRALGRAARAQPLLVIIEDLHWADESTLSLFTHLAARVAPLPWVIIGTYRHGYTDDNPALARTLEELIRMRVPSLALRGLSQGEVSRMLQGLSSNRASDRLASLIFEDTEGNPFFVEEVYKHLVEDGRIFDAAGSVRTDLTFEEIDVPENLRLVIDRRLARLDEHERRALAAAAVIGRSFSFQLLGAISDLDVDDLFAIVEKAQQMGTIVSTAEGPETPFTFSHELVRQTLLGSVSAPRRQKLHARVAEAIERLHPRAGDERAGEIADHLLKARSFAEPAKVVRYLTLTGMRALEVAAYHEAHRNLESALQYQEGSSRWRAEVLSAMGTADQGLGRMEEALDHWRDAFDIFVAIGDRDVVGNAFSALTDVLIWGGRVDDALELARHVGMPELEEQVIRRQLLQRASTEPEPAPTPPDPDAAVRALDDLTVSRFMFFRFEEALASGLAAAAASAPDETPWRTVERLFMMQLTLNYLGRLDDAARISVQLEPLADEIGHHLARSLCVQTNAWAAFARQPELDRLGQALHRALDILRIAKVPTPMMGLAVGQLSVLGLLRGDWNSARSLAAEARNLEMLGPGRSANVGLLFRQMAYEGDREGALALLDETHTQLPSAGEQNAGGAWCMLAMVVEGLALLGERARAAALYPLTRELLATGGRYLWSVARMPEIVAGTAAAAGGDWDAAAAHFASATRLAESLPVHVERTEVRRYHAMMLLDRGAPGDRDVAAAYLREALAGYARVGMPEHEQLVRRLLERT